MVDGKDLQIKTLGNCRIDSPLLGHLLTNRGHSVHYVEESDRVLFDDTLSAVTSRSAPVAEFPGFEPAGPRRKIFFDPSKTRAGIVTCGGLCPGLNDVIRSLCLELIQRYGVQKVYGFCNGYQGFVPKFCRPVLELTPALVDDINEHGGTILGSSRGEQDPAEVID
ncbi:MAG TPA: 6-phosphofructokinase, partial [Tepidisphaeraceae bacterium]|nr:6-phosphofructokinase [Tepidisphaeraceae bacterium]